MAPESLIEKYTRLANSKPGVCRVGWTDVLQQALQFAQFTALNIGPADSVLDAGCGVGDLLIALTRQGFGGPYTGVDLLPLFIDQAQTQFANRPDTQFIAGDLLALSLPPHDFIFASGLFDYYTDDIATRWPQTIAALFSLSCKAFGWNGYYQLPAHRNDMWAADLSQIATLCQSLSPWWHLRADYAPGHYTACLFKRAYWFTPALQTLIGHLFLDPSLIEALVARPHDFADRYGVTLQQLNALGALVNRNDEDSAGR